MFSFLFCFKPLPQSSTKCPASFEHSDWEGLYKPGSPKEGVGRRDIASVFAWGWAMELVV